MMGARGLRGVVIALIVLGAMAFGASGQADAPAPAAGGLDAALVARLTALRPDQPMAYFELAEEVAAQENHADGRRLARGLFALAYELDKLSTQPVGLGASVCLALAQLAETTGEAQWLLEVGRALDRSPSPLLLPGFAGIASGADTSARLLMAQAIGMGRDDEGKSTRAIITRAEVRPLMQPTMTALGSVSGVLTASEARPHCPGCAGRRFNRAAGDGAAALQPCPVCLGNPGLRLSSEQLLRSLSVEATLLRAEHQFWGAQVLADGGSTLREPDPSELARAYGVDPGRPYWTSDLSQPGAWQWARTPSDSGARQ